MNNASKAKKLISILKEINQLTSDKSRDPDKILGQIRQLSCQYSQYEVDDTPKHFYPVNNQ